MHDQIQLMTVFVAVAEEMSFAAAGQRLNLSPPAVTRAIANLEQQLGAKLLQRTTRSVGLTDAGGRYLEDARNILMHVDKANEAVQGADEAPRGKLTVTAPLLFGQKWVMPAVSAYLAKYPDSTIDALFVDRLVSLVEEGVDVAVRIGPMPDSTMRAKRVGFVSEIIVASPDYLARVGPINTIDTLKTQSIIASTAGQQSPTWRFACAGRSRSLKLRPRLTVTDNQSAIIAAVSGLGITRAMSYQVEAELACGRLVKILSDFELSPLPINVVHRQDKYFSNKVRAFIEILTKTLQDKQLNP